MGLSKTEVEHIAGLARLELIAAEQEQFTAELNEFLAFAQKLNQLHLEAVRPMGT